jgi:hypothetical protein
MTYTAPNSLQRDPSTVVTVDWDAQEALIESPKFFNTFHIYKPRDQTAFFKVRMGTGVISPKLDGHFSGLQTAIDFVCKYIYDSQETFAAKSERRAAEREEAKIAKANTKGR